MTRRGNNGQGVFKDEEDFLKALYLMVRYSEIHAEKVCGYCLMYNHGHWMFEASTEESISNLMRDMLNALLPFAMFRV